MPARAPRLRGRAQGQEERARALQVRGRLTARTARRASLREARVRILNYYMCSSSCRFRPGRRGLVRIRGLGYPLKRGALKVCAQLGPRGGVGAPSAFSTVDRVCTGGFVWARGALNGGKRRFSGPGSGAHHRRPGLPRRLRGRAWPWALLSFRRPFVYFVWVITNEI